MHRIWYRGRFIGFQIGQRKLLWDALTARAIRRSKEEDRG